MTPKVKIVYFDVQGRMEMTRMMLTVGKVKYEEEKIQMSEWPKMKASTPFGSLPIFYWDGEEIAQGWTIARFVAKKVGLAGKNDMEFAFADEILEHANDLIKQLPPIRWVRTQEERVEPANKLLQDYIPGWLTRAEGLLKKRGGKWFSGSGLTFGDIAMENVLGWIIAPEEMTFHNMDNKEERAKLLDAYPLLKDHYHRVRAVPEIADYIKNRPPFAGL